MSQDAALQRHYDHQLIAVLQQRRGEDAAHIEELEAENALLTLESRRQVNELEAAQIDARTGLHNANSFEAGLKRYEFDETTGVALFDLSNFKNLNDYVSYTVGNRHLRRAASVALQVAAELGLPARAIARVGGDEIGGFIPIGLGWQYVIRVEEEFGEETFETPEGIFVVRLCGGFSHPSGGESPNSSKFDAAETAMKAFKREFYSGELARGHLISRSLPQ